MELLDQLVAGTGMDVREGDEQSDAPLVVYRSFDDLYNYCYHVASVVGLVCIRIFGYRDPVAEQYAEHLGIAFQLTNILRDVKEDAAMARIYLPQQDLERFGVTAAELGAGVPMEKLRPLLAFEAARAREFYVSAGTPSSAHRRGQPARAVGDGGDLSRHPRPHRTQTVRCVFRARAPLAGR